MLYKEHRPDKFSDIIGNKQTISLLEKAYGGGGKVPQAILLHGGTGCGKTTIARIIKNVLEVSDRDYQEINFAEMRGIDTAREIIKNSYFKPISSKYKVYLIDEAHKMTNDAQNAFLKPLEDMPPHVIYIICTTEPQKLLKTITGRCIQYPLSPLTEKEMKRLLMGIARKEGDKIDSEVLEIINESSQGHPRNAINILESVLAVAPEKRAAVAKTVQETKAQAIDLCRALINRDSWNKIKIILENLKGQEAETIRRIVLGYCQSVILKKAHDQAAFTMEQFMEPFYHTGFPQLVLACYVVVKQD